MMYGDKEIVADLFDNWDDYSWTIMSIFQDTDGLLWWADDSGCSCNGPWDSWNGEPSFFELTDETWDDFVKCVKGFPADPDERAWFVSAANRLLRQS